MSRAKEIAGRMTDHVMLNSPFMAKSAGSREMWESRFLPGAKVIARLERQVAMNGKRIKANEAKWHEVAVSSNGHGKLKELQPVPWTSSLN